MPRSASPSQSHPVFSHAIGTDLSLPFSRQPIPVALQRKDLKAELERAVASTYMNVTTGTSL
jgi:hypothetical protein